MTPHTEWADRSSAIFQETAEALGTSTDTLMAAMECQVGDGIFVIAMYTPDYEAGSRAIHKVVLGRGPDGILHLVKRDVMEDGLDQLEAYMEQEIE